MNPVSEVAVNVMWLRPGKVGGSETYIRRVLRSLAGAEPGLEDLRIIGPVEATSAMGLSGATFIAPPVTSRSRAARVAMERLWLARVMDTGSGVLHHPGGTVPFDSARPTVVTIHDLQPITNPQYFSRTKQEFLARALPEAVERADVVATPSDWVRQDVIERLGADPDRVVTVSAYAGQSEDADLGTSSPELSPELEAIVERGPVILFPAMTLGHKNHRFLFDAFAIAQAKDPSLSLVCTGSEGKDHEAIVAYAASASPAIHMLGHVERGDLRGLFSRAEMLVFPSLYEGFGLPVLEAQSAQLPVIASSSTAIPEVAGDGAIICDPTDLEAWADAMANRLGSAERADLVDRGTANARRYSSEQTAQQQLGAYERAAS